MIDQRPNNNNYRIVLCTVFKDEQNPYHVVLGYKRLILKFMDKTKKKNKC